MERNIDDPLKPVPFSDFPRLIGWDSSIDMYIYDRTTIHGCLRNMHIYPRASDRRWNREFRKAVEAFADESLKEGQTEPEHDIPSEEVPPSSD